MISFSYRFQLDAANGQILLATNISVTGYANVKAANDDLTSAPPGGAVQALAGASTARSAWLVQQTQIGKYHTRCGHGFTAEDANALDDLWSGRWVDQVGTSNTLNGADRISAGVAIQTKYCASADASLSAAFGTDGLYRYPGQVLEVPPEQYADIVAGMAQAISEERVAGVSDPARAGDLVREGSVSYARSCGIRRSGTLDSLAFDAKLHAMNTVLSAGIGFGADLFGGRAQPKIMCRRVLEAAATGATTGAKTLFTGVVTSQVLRTQSARKMTVVMRHGVRAAARTSAGLKAVDAVATVSLGKAVSGAAAVNHCSKLTRSSVIGGVVSLVATSAPNVARAMVGKMTWGQLGRRGVEDAASTAGGMAGWTLCFTIGSIACATVMTGGAVLVGGAVIGTAGSIAAGAGASKIARMAVDAVVGEDVAPAPLVYSPSWLDALLVGQHASALERARVLQECRGRLRPWCKLDRARVDSEAMEQARFEVIASLASVRADGRSTRAVGIKRAA